MTPHNLTILYTLLKIIQIGWNSFQMLVKRFQRGLPPEKGPTVKMTVYVDTEHGHDLVLRILIPGILFMLNNTPIRWISKRQKTVETSTCGSELVTSRVATELILEVRYMLRSLVVALDGPALMLGDNISVVLKATVPSKGFEE
jgi:hypothetical protein